LKYLSDIAGRGREEAHAWK